MNGEGKRENPAASVASNPFLKPGIFSLSLHILLVVLLSGLGSRYGVTEAGRRIYRVSLHSLTVPEKLTAPEKIEKTPPKGRTNSPPVLAKSEIKEAEISVAASLGVAEPVALPENPKAEDSPSDPLPVSIKSPPAEIESRATLPVLLSAPVSSRPVEVKEDENTKPSKKPEPDRIALEGPAPTPPKEVNLPRPGEGLPAGRGGTSGPEPGGGSGTGTEAGTREGKGISATGSSPGEGQGIASAASVGNGFRIMSGGGGGEGAVVRSGVELQGGGAGNASGSEVASRNGIVSGQGGGIGNGTSSRRASGGGNGGIATALPRHTENTKPVYPSEARQKGYGGQVLLRVEVLSNGLVGQVEIKKSSGHEILDRSALVAVKKWKFLPARQEGEPVTSWVNIPIKFELL